jgi:hypothetical protein
MVPAITGNSRATTVPDRWQWTAAILGGGGVLGFGTFMYADRGGFTIALMQALASTLVIAGVVLGIGAVVAMLTLLSRGVVSPTVMIIAQVLGLVAAGAVATILFGSPGMIGGAGAVITLVLIATRTGLPSTYDDRTAGTLRTAWSVPLAVLMLVTVIIDALHVRVWNPLAKVPGHSLEEIYAGLAAVGQASAAFPFLVLWAVFWSPPALLFPLLCRVGRLTPRMTAVLGLLMVGCVTFTGIYPAAAVSVGIADTFGTDGGDAPTPSSGFLQVTGQGAFAAALIIALVPVRAAERLSVAPARLPT